MHQVVCLQYLASSRNLMAILPASALAARGSMEPVEAVLAEIPLGSMEPVEAVLAEIPLYVWCLVAGGCIVPHTSVLSGRLVVEPVEPFQNFAVLAAGPPSSVLAGDSKVEAIDDRVDMRRSIVLVCIHA